MVLWVGGSSPSLGAIIIRGDSLTVERVKFSSFLLRSQLKLHFESHEVEVRLFLAPRSEFQRLPKDKERSMHLIKSIGKWQFSQESVK